MASAGCCILVPPSATQARARARIEVVQWLISVPIAAWARISLRPLRQRAGSLGPAAHLAQKAEAALVDLAQNRAPLRRRVQLLMPAHLQYRPHLVHIFS